MSDVFISYKREDEARVAKVVRGLEKAGFTVWWRRGLTGGESWRAEIEAALAAAGCVIVAWTKASVGTEGDFVRDEANNAKARGILVPILLDRVHPPLGFREVQAIDLRRWRGAASNAFFKDLVASVRAKLDGAPAPAARGPAMRLIRRVTAGGLASTAAAGLLAFTMNTLSVQNHLCTVPIGQPGLSDSCGAINLGQRPTRQERIAFEALPAGDCAALSAYRAKYEKSPLRAVVDSRLADRREAPTPRWAPHSFSQTLFQPQTAAPAATEADARAAAIAAAQGQAERLCRIAAASGLFRLRGARPEAEDWTCETYGGGRVCGFMGRAECAMERREPVYVCGKAP
jgi:hypothetical protein